MLTGIDQYWPVLNSPVSGSCSWQSKGWLMAFTSVCKRGELQWNLDHNLPFWCMVNVNHSQIQHDGQGNLGRRHSFVTTAGQEISLSTIRYASSCLLSWTMQGREKTWSWEVSESLRYWFNSLFAWKSPWSSPAVKKKLWFLVHLELRFRWFCCRLDQWAKRNRTLC